MKAINARVIVCVLMSMFMMQVSAQTSNSEKKEQNNKPAAATLTAQEVKAYSDYLNTHTAAQMGLAEGDFELFKELFANGNEPIFATVEVAGQVAGRSYAANDSLCVYIIRTDMLRLFSYPIRTNEKEAAAAAAQDAKIKLAAARAWAVEELNEGRPRHRSEVVADLSDGTQVTIPTRASDKFGWSLIAGGTYQMGSDLNAFSGEVGISYSISDHNGRCFVMPEVLASVRRTHYNNNANAAGQKYWSYGTAATLFGGVALGKHGEHRLAVGAGLGWEFYKTDSQRRVYDDGSWDEMSSWGNYLYPEFKLRYEWNGFNSPVGFFAGIGLRQHSSVWQNEDSEKSWLGMAELGVKINIFRHVTNNK